MSKNIVILAIFLSFLFSFTCGGGGSNDAAKPINGIVTINYSIGSGIYMADRKLWFLFISDINSCSQMPIKMEYKAIDLTNLTGQITVAGINATEIYLVVLYDKYGIGGSGAVPAPAAPNGQISIDDYVAVYKDAKFIGADLNCTSCGTIEKITLKDGEEVTLTNTINIIDPDNKITTPLRCTELF
jgi:hypothetical protein